MENFFDIKKHRKTRFGFQGAVRRVLTVLVNNYKRGDCVGLLNYT
jgi:hypothetical protein